MKIILEVTAILFGVVLASITGPAVKEYFEPKIKIVCPICGEYIDQSKRRGN